MMKSVFFVFFFKEFACARKNVPPSHGIARYRTTDTEKCRNFALSMKPETRREAKEYLACTSHEPPINYTAPKRRNTGGKREENRRKTKVLVISDSKLRNEVVMWKIMCIFAA